MIELTNDEAESLLDWLELHLIDDIRSDEDIDNLEWLSNMVSVYNKCKSAPKEVSIAVGGPSTISYVDTTAQWVKTGLTCKSCGGPLLKNVAKVLTSSPPQYEYKCEHCGAIEYHL